MFENLSNFARRVLVLANEESRIMNHDSVDTGHLLVGTMAQAFYSPEMSFPGLIYLTSHGVNLNTVRSAMQDLRPDGFVASPAHLPFTDGGKKVLQLAFADGQEKGRETLIGTDNLLAALASEQLDAEEPSLRLLEDLGISLDELRLETAKLPVQ
jgi:ATP-dependent Clp protease ATP-binding subunit ClpA